MLIVNYSNISAFSQLQLPYIMFYASMCYAVVEHAYELASAAQKQELLLELYSTELQLFKDLVPSKESR